jgi:flavodoxin
MQALVVYYSRTGHTRKVGEEIAKELSCDVEEIVDTVNRSGPIGYIYSGKQASMKELTKLQPLKKDISTYDIVIIGTPVWAATMSTPIRTFIVENKDKIKMAAFFITLGGMAADTTLKDLEGLYGKKPRATLVVNAPDLKSGAYADALKKFAGELRA